MGMKHFIRGRPFPTFCKSLFDKEEVACMLKETFSRRTHEIRGAPVYSDGMSSLVRTFVCVARYTAIAAVAWGDAAKACLIVCHLQCLCLANLSQGQAS